MLNFPEFYRQNFVDWGYIESDLNRYRLEPDQGSYRDSDEHYMVAAVSKYIGIATNITWWQRFETNTAVSVLKQKGIGTLQ